MDYSTLVVKNIPKNIKPSEFFKKNYNAIAARYFGRARAVVRFANEVTAKNALLKLHQSYIEKHLVSVEYLGKRELTRPHEELTAQAANQNLPNFAKKILATSAGHGFNHPPPAHLKYCYPKINRDILDSISIALLTNAKFYTQVLHLMNRMNLEPPFLERKKPFIPPGELEDAQTQTDFEKLEKLLATDESEMESSSEGEPVVKRLKTDKESENSNKIRKKLKQVIKSQSKVKQMMAKSNKHDALNPESLFDSPIRKSLGNKITLNVASIKLSEQISNSSDVDCNTPIPQTVDEIPLPNDVDQEITFAMLDENRIPEAQLQEMPIYKNYQVGESTDKLYVRNLGKDVSVDDLKAVYRIFVSDVDTQLEIKLMQHGRMKGQAFVKFLNCNDDKCYDNIAKALRLTNGYILKKKPMIVCFGKK